MIQATISAVSCTCIDVITPLSCPHSPPPASVLYGSILVENLTHSSRHQHVIHTYAKAKSDTHCLYTTHRIFLCIVAARVAWSILASSTYLKSNLDMVHSGSWSESTVCASNEVEVYVSQWIDTDRFDKEAMVTLPLGSCENLLASFSLTAKSQSLSPPYLVP